MKKKITFALLSVLTMATLAAQNNNETQRMLNRYLSYVKIEAQSTYPEDPSQEFPINEGQKQMAQHIYEEVKSFGKGVEVQMSPDFYLYIKVSSNIRRRVPSICLMAHLDVSPEVQGVGVKPQVICDYDGGVIPLGTSGRVLSPDSVQGVHLKDVIGHTIVTSDGTTNTGADDKTGCAILVSLVDEFTHNKNIKHGDVYICITQNEDVGLAAYRINLGYFDKRPDILIDVDGGNVGRFSSSNFSAIGRTYLFHGNQRHPSYGKENGLVDAQTAMSYFIGQLPPDVNPMFSSDRQGYLQAYIIEDLHNGDFRVKFRMRYFDKADSIRYATYLADAEKKTLEAFPGLEIVLEANYLQYDNVAYSMHPQTIPVINRAAEKSGMKLEPEELRAGTTGGMLVARGLPGAPCLFSGQQAEHTVYEWCSIDELVQLTHLCIAIVEEVAKL